jgi:hypothetical protein
LNEDIKGPDNRHGPLGFTEKSGDETKTGATRPGQARGPAPTAVIFVIQVIFMMTSSKIMVITRITKITVQDRREAPRA